MQAPDSSTQFFYDWLDLSESEQQDAIARLQVEQPDLYQEVLPLLTASAATSLHQVLAHHALAWAADSADYSQQLIDKYQLHDEIGRGGIGIVYAATRADNTYEQQLAVKLIQPHIIEQLGQRALFAEAQILARLNHPGIAKVYDGGLFHDQVYIVMEYIHGPTLDSYLQQQELTRQDKLRLFIRICQAVEHAHDHQVLHADLKPANILISSGDQPKLIDFNLTQKFKPQSAQLHDSSLLAFSNQYASPEQKQGEYLTQQSDVYSLGKILHAVFPTPKAGSDLACIIAKATESDTGQRYLSVGDLRHDVEHLLALRPISLRQHLPFYLLKRLVQRRPFYCLLLSLLLASATSFTIAVIEKNRQLSAEKKISDNMLFELTQLLFHSKNSLEQPLSIDAMLEITRRRILSNPDIPQHIKQKMLLALLTPTPPKQHNRPTAQPATPNQP
ncbi:MULTISPECIES: serine/threonine-protein kinase [Vibrio]|uniref:Serine/threonine protein kinase n=1 Tax=Vibrio ostreae TaxID=2841925 RepID=A0A975U8U3_9VIBR|nr:MULTISPECIES: serine/threonine-protein kinase [Vibrio]QXO17323.1 serine/threonine protein kinase [Vibrio ostreae]